MNDLFPGVNFQSVEWLRVLGSMLRIAGILLAAWIATRMLHRAVTAFRIRATTRIPDANARQRTETLGRAFRYLVTVVVSAITVMRFATRRSSHIRLSACSWPSTEPSRSRCSWRRDMAQPRCSR